MLWEIIRILFYVGSPLYIELDYHYCHFTFTSPRFAYLWSPILLTIRSSTKANPDLNGMSFVFSSINLKIFPWLNSGFKIRRDQLVHQPGCYGNQQKLEKKCYKIVSLISWLLSLVDSPFVLFGHLFKSHWVPFIYLFSN